MFYATAGCDTIRLRPLFVDYILQHTHEHSLK